MTKLSRIAISFTLCIAGSACTTIVDIKKVPTGCRGSGDAKVCEENIKGQRFALPKPYLVLTADSNGTVKPKIEYFPDPDNTYAISAESIGATHGLTIETNSRGVLSKVILNQNNAGVSAQLAESYGSVRSAELTSEAEAREAADEEAKNAANKAKEPALALEAADAEHELAVSIVQRLEDAGQKGTEQYAQALVRLATAEAAREKASEAMDNISGRQLDGVTTLDEAFVPEIVQQNNLSFIESPGALWYNIAFRPDGSVLLEEVVSQRSYFTTVLNPGDTENTSIYENCTSNTNVGREVSPSNLGGEIVLRYSDSYALLRNMQVKWQSDEFVDASFSAEFGPEVNDNMGEGSFMHISINPEIFAGEGVFEIRGEARNEDLEYVCVSGSIPFVSN